MSGVLLAGVGAGSPGFMQVAGVTETPLRAVGADAARRQASPPEAQTSYYANVLPAQSDGTIDHVDSIPGYQFATIKLVVSVAPGIFAGSQDMSGGQAAGSLGALRHLNAHITVRPLDGNGQVIEPKRPGSVVLATLEISPSEPVFSDTVSNRQSAISTAVGDVTSVIRPLSGVLQAFQSSFHRRPATTQVSYMTGPNAFGWRWYESPGLTIEGLHYSTALLQVANEIKSLRITVDLVADWRAFGVWAKSFEFTYALTRPAQP